MPRRPGGDRRDLRRPAVVDLRRPIWVLPLAAMLGLASVGLARAQEAAAPPAALSPATASVPAQNPRAGAGIYTLNQDQLYKLSAFGKRVQRQLLIRRKALKAENSTLESGLKAEEQHLTDIRKTTSPVDFRKLADAFDAKVQKIRKDQAIKSNALDSWAANERSRFFKLAYPILLKMAAELNAVAVLDERMTLISSRDISLTARAIQRINAELGDGAKDKAGKKHTP